MPAPDWDAAEVARLKEAIDAEDFDLLRSLMLANPGLHRAPLGYGGDGPLTWVAECRVPWRPPSPTRLAIARWMIENGSDVHQGNDGPLMRAALNGDRIPMMQLLVDHGASVNAVWRDGFPVIFAPCESVAPAPLQWLLDHGADPNPPGVTALDYLIGSYARTPRLPQCIDILLRAGGRTRFDLPGVLPILRGRADELTALLDADPELVHRTFPQLDFGASGGRRLTLSGATLLHLAAEYGALDAAVILLDRGASPDALADPSRHTPIFHSAAQFNDYGLEVTRLLVERGASLSARTRLPGHYERPDEFVDATPLDYAELFPGAEWPGSNARTLLFLRSRHLP